MGVQETEASAADPKVPIYIIVQQSLKKSIAESYNANLSKLVGKIHIFCGAVSFFTGACLIINSTNPSSHPGVETAGVGILCSVSFFLSGYLGMLTAKKTKTSWIICTMVVGIVSATFSGLLIIWSIMALVPGKFHYDDCDHNVSVGMNGLQVLIGVTELVLAIISSSISCKATCCRDKKDTSTKRKIKSGHISDLDHEQIMALLRQVNGPEGEADVEAAVVGGGAAVDPPTYAELARADEEEEQSIEE